MKWFTIEHVALLLLLIVVLALSFFIYSALNIKYEKKKAEYSNQSTCRQVYRQQFIRNWTDYFWSNSMRFAWITLTLISIIIYGITVAIYLHVEEAAYVSIFFSIITILFFIFSYVSYKNFPQKAKKALTDFENAIKAGLQKETDLNGDIIQKFAKENAGEEEYLFDFVIGPKKIDFPPFENRPAKKPVISERKLEFLLLSREFFSICQGATPFNLLNPERLPQNKKCALKKAAGACKEYYYSQVKNVTYENENIVIYFNNGDEPIKYSCPKKLGKHAEIINAFRDKLRITERQRLAKIDEHKKFIDIKVDKHDKFIDDTEEESESEE